MRRKLGRGEKELRAAIEVIFSRMAARAAGWKTRRLWSSVMMRVLLGGLGRERAGRFERSSVRAGLDLGELVSMDDAMLLFVLGLLLLAVCFFSSEKVRSFLDNV